MKHITTILLIFTLSLTVNARAPRWVTVTPASENNTYRYVVEHATDVDETKARNKAMILVFQDAIISLGIIVSTDQLMESLDKNDGDFNVVASEFKIPVNKVCSYTERFSSGGFRVYLLCQVAVKSDRVQQPQFTEFRNCGASESTVAVSGYPWAHYETDKYVSCSVQREIEKGEKVEEVKRAMAAETRKAVLSRINIKDEKEFDDIVSQIQTKTYKEQKSNMTYAISFVERDIVNNIYEERVKNAVNICYNQLKVAQSLLNEGSAMQADAKLDIINNDIEKKIMPPFNYLRVYNSTRSVSHFIEDVEDLQSQVSRLKSGIIIGSKHSQKEKVEGLVKNAIVSQSQFRLSYALRYYYYAQVLLHEMDNWENVTIQLSSNSTPLNANNYITTQLRSLLSEIEVSFGGFMDKNKREAKLNFLYKGQQVTNLHYTYNDNTGWSGVVSVKNGWSIMQMPSNIPQTIAVKIEYQYEDESVSDPVVQRVIGNKKIDYDEEAEHRVIVEDILVPTGKSGRGMTAAQMKANTDICQNIVADEIVGECHKVSQEDSIKYRRVIDRVCQGITSRRYDKIEELFTMKGYGQFLKLVDYGKAKVIPTFDCRFIRIDDEVMCRSVPMSFKFTKGKEVNENVVFTFDKEGRIDGLQFAIDAQAERNVACSGDYTEAAKLTIINFMENYQTAFALKDIDYIRSIFSDKAIIFVGRVLQSAEDRELGRTTIENTEMLKLSKSEYMERLGLLFDSKEWININFGSIQFEKSVQGPYYAINLLQEYTSSNYGDRGYLFLFIDCNDTNRIQIRYRTWQPEEAGVVPITMGYLDNILRETE